MFFTVGWHYAKQGYGILMLDAGRKGLRLTGTERRWLLGNTHLVWFTWWLVANDALQAKELWGIEYYLLDVPDAVMIPLLTLAALSTAATAWHLSAACRRAGTVPVNGLVAYAAAVYVWLYAGCLDPILLFVVPSAVGQGWPMPCRSEVEPRQVIRRRHTSLASVPSPNYLDSTRGGWGLYGARKVEDVPQSKQALR